jgi:hypothetical protein
MVSPLLVAATEVLAESKLSLGRLLLGLSAPAPASVGHAPRAGGVGASIYEQGCHSRWQVLAVGAYGDVVGRLRTLVGGDDPAERPAGGAAAAAP